MLTIQKLATLRSNGKKVPCPYRILRTSDGRLVPAGHPDGRWLFRAIGQPILESALAEFKAGQEPPKKVRKPKKEKPPKKEAVKAEEPAKEKDAVDKPETKESKPSTKEAKPKTKKRPREGRQE